ncbi:chemotaxis protein CheA [Clostridium oryzae]|uniref:Chemotaxis protein CheA n=1 Tax=Clostridium oryzae TaxID=1450648 RepID=A0A1V4IQ17_9CLOT|nr:chemotaxis protein CheA [Clostridium oryzae]
MADEYKNDSMLDIYIFETSQLIEQLEQLILYAERENEFSSNDINEIFRIMHTIKGSSAMMSYHNISTLAHELEELFYFIREKKVKYVNKSKLSDLVLDGIDFIKIELQKIKNCDDVDGNAADIINNIKKLLQASKDCNNNGDCKKQNKSTKILINKELVHKYDYKAVIKFEEESGMESFRAIMVLNNLKEHTDDYYYIPEDILESENCEGFIKRNGLIVFFNWDNEYEKIQTFLMIQLYH